jgi:hypothetical protein
MEIRSMRRMRLASQTSRRIFLEIKQHPPMHPLLEMNVEQP